MYKSDISKIAVIGLGYVGLPLAIAFSKFYPVVGYDINVTRCSEIKKGVDKTKEVDCKELLQVQNFYLSHKGQLGLLISSEEEHISDCDCYIITVPTPLDDFKRPDLSLLKNATKLVANHLRLGDFVIFESTVYPGCTEEECIPLLEQNSGLKCNKDFHVGYSPERINPGDKRNTLLNIIKITSGSNSYAAHSIDNLYKNIINVGTHMAPSIKVAEASKAIENAQRDLNISFMNEIALIFDKLKIDTKEVLDAASTKYNFLKFEPGLVGGHCISTDPYYLVYKAEKAGYSPEVIHSGRRVNEYIPKFIANKVIKLLIHKEIKIKNSKALILGITFKENCPDIRNSKVSEVYYQLKDYGLNVDIYDPIADAKDAKIEFGIDLMKKKPESFDNYSAIILAVAHREFQEINFSRSNKKVLFDIKSILQKEIADARL